MNKLTLIHKKTSSRRGFSLAETLIVVGILIILLALLVPNLVQRQKELRQKELDAKAEILYVAAQNELAKLRASGNGKTYSNLRAGVTDPDGERVLATSSSLITAEKNWMSGAADAGLLSGHWVIVYNAKTAAVIEVYYSETDEFGSDYLDYAGPDDVPIKQTNRYKKGAYVGYYNGKTEGMDDTDKVELDPRLDVINGEKLIVSAFCPTDQSVGKLKFELVIKDIEGNPCTKTSIVSYSASNGGYRWEITLDDLSGARFASVCSELKAGSPLTMTLTVSGSESGSKVEPNDVTYKNPYTGEDTFNGLFADSSEWDASAEVLTADIACGRHLQNLDGYSEVCGAKGVMVDQANQKENIYFGDKKNGEGEWEESEWKKTYDTLKFTPIVNTFLTSYNGNNLMISDLNADVDVNGNSGLFGEIMTETDLENIRLVNTKARGNTNAGALAGKVSGTCTITNCGAYLEGTIIDTLKSDWNSDLWFMNQNSYLISGNGNVGGLVGSAEGALTISNSFAATALRGTNAGGLVGASLAGLSIETSYADCYVAGIRTGGLVGGSGNPDGFSTVATLEKSYAAGFLCPTMPRSTSAGLVNGKAETVTSCYSICDLGDAWLMYPTVALCDEAPSNLYYFYGGNMTAFGEGVSTARELSSRLTDPAFKSSAKTKAYNLDNGNRKNYAYLHLAGNEKEMHYGDWKEGIQQGSFVYYEYYDTGFKAGKYGIAYAGESTLDTQAGNTVRGDGYAVALEKGHNNPLVTVIYNGVTYSSAPTAGQEALTIRRNADCGGTIYDLYCLPASALIASPLEAGFYQLATVTVGPNTSYYYFNPHFAATSYEAPMNGSTVLAPEQPTSTGASISVRSARQLYCMSLYYDSKYFSATLGCTFNQERDIDYQAYGWTDSGGIAGFGGTAPIAEQQPIGCGGGTFSATYNGGYHTITHLGISSTGLNVGLFGKSSGIIENVFFVNDYYGAEIINDNTKPAGTQVDYVIKELHRIGTNESYNIGALVGFNGGTVRNCAAAGFRLVGSDDITDDIIYTYTNSTISIGGLVGRNNGQIFSCSVVMPELKVDSIYSNASIGGFTGTNRGDIRGSYAIGALDATEKESSVSMAGFAGTNVGGQISGSYCAVAMNGSGTISTYGFAPKDGSVNSDCLYLDKGTYSFAGGLYSYDGGTATAGSSVTFDALAARGWTAEVTPINTHNHVKTVLTPTVQSYPFPGAVTNGYAYVHFGDWLTAPNLGEFGLFYWEEETGGANPGYHFSCLGRLQSGDEWVDVSDSTLCVAHDDGGTISRYGYGYYLIGQPEAVEAPDSTTGVTPTSKDGTIKWSADAYDTVAKEKLQTQMPGYTFYPFATSHDETDDSYIYLNSGYVMSSETATKDKIKDGAAAQADGSFGEWTLTYHKDGETQAHTYYLTPFFANAMVSESKDGAAATYAPGSSAHRFGIRSVQQLQYINWNMESKNCAQLVDGRNRQINSGNYQKFPFLQYATTLDGDQKNDKTGVFRNRPYQYWLQTHDLHGDGIGDYTPIAGKRTSSGTANKEDAEAPLFAWFGGSYDGQSYKIQNLNIVSDSFTVGLFGVTVGAEIKNIILYGDGTTRVERDTGSGSQVGEKRGAYQIGGLIGLAYDYDTSSSEKVSTISNCAIADYIIKDSSHNQHGRGYASVGGLFGITQQNLKKCSAVVDIQLDYHSPKDSSGQYIYSPYGNMLRAGGLAGTALYLIEDCYTGGSITVDAGASTPDEPDYNSTLFEKPKGYILGGTNNSLDRNNSLQIFVGGIAGSVYNNGIYNFGRHDNKATDGTVAIKNCYTYVVLPRLEGNIYAASVIAGVGDRFNQGSNIDVTNCHFLENEVLKNYPYTLGEMEVDHASETGFSMDFKFSTGSRNSLTYGEIRNILYGNLDILRYVLNNQNASHRTPKVDQQNARGYDYFSSQAMIDALGNTVWSRVTLEEHGNPVNGKYSFSSEPDQKGKDYPFPAVVKQDDVWVHYGEWAKNGAYWALGRGSMDIFTDKKPTSENPAVISEFTQTVTLSGGATFPEGTTFSAGGSNGDAEVLEGTTFSIDRTTAEVKLRAKTGGVLTLTGSAPDGEVVSTTEIQLAPAEKEFTEKLVQPITLDSPVTVWTRSEPQMNPATGVEEQTFASGDGSLSFTLSPAGKAEVIMASASEDGMALKVWLRAIAPGTVSLTDHNTGAICDVSITQNLTVIASDDMIQLTMAGAEDKTYSCDAYPAELEQIPANCLTGMGTWSITGAADSIKVTQLTGNNANKFTLKYLLPGDTSVTALYTYNYFGTEVPGAKVIQVRTMGYFGLADGTRAVEIKRGVDEECYVPATYPSVVKPQGADVFLYAPLSEGDLADFNITVTSDEGVTVSLFMENGHPVIMQDKANGYQYIGMTLRSEAGFRDDVTVHVHLYKYAGTDEHPDNMELELSGLKAYQFQIAFDGNTGTGSMRPMGFTENDTLTGNLFTKAGHKFKGWSLVQNPGSEDILYEDRRVLVDQPAIEPEEETEGQPEILYYTELCNRASQNSGTVTLYAQWEAVEYTVRYDPYDPFDYNPNQIVPVVYRYDEDNPGITLKDESIFTETFGDAYSIPAGMAFDGWNTDFRGRGTRYEAGHIDGNLAEENGAEITLFAQWKQATFDLELHWDTGDGPQSVTFAIANGWNILPEYPTEEMTELGFATEKNGWTLTGWYTIPEEGSDAEPELVVDAEGKVVSRTISGYAAEGAFALDMARSLQARWERTAYFQVDQLDQGAADNGTYLIASGDEGWVYLAENDFSGSSDSTAINRSAAQYSVFEGSFLNASGKFIADTGVLNSDRWTITFVDIDDLTIEGGVNSGRFSGTYRTMYWVQNCNDRYLRHHSDKNKPPKQHSTGLKNTPKYGGANNESTYHSNRNVFMYGTVPVSAVDPTGEGMLPGLYSQFGLMEAKTTHSFGYKSNDTFGFEVGANCYLFKQCTIYTLTPTELS